MRPLPATPRRPSATPLLALLACLTAGSAARAAEPKQPLQVVVIYLGGPDAGGEGKRMIDQLVAFLAESSGMEPSAFGGAYFTESAPALEHLRRSPDAFVLGSLGFFAAHRKELGLVPLADLRTPAGPQDRESLVVRKGRYPDLASLKGKSLWGSPLYEHPDWIDRVIFGGQLKAAEHFVLRPTPRPLSALRKLEKDEVDAVLLNAMQAEALSRLPSASKLEVIWQSQPRPSLGLMRTDGKGARSASDKVLATVLGLCESEKGKPLCANFGIAGFSPASPKALEPALKAFDGK